MLGPVVVNTVIISTTERDDVAETVSATLSVTTITTTTPMVHYMQLGRKDGQIENS